jgi:hypothetical protein
MLRDIMLLAWRKCGYERGAMPFSAALRHAWAWFRGAATREAAEERYRSAPQHRTLCLGSMVRSPIRRSLTGQYYAYTLARYAGRITSHLGA